jgi:hypothetical protein
VKEEKKDQKKMMKKIINLNQLVLQSHLLRAKKTQMSMEKKKSQKRKIKMMRSLKISLKKSNLLENSTNLLLKKIIK